MGLVGMILVRSCCVSCWWLWWLSLLVVALVHCEGECPCVLVSHLSMGIGVL